MFYDNSFCGLSHVFDIPKHSILLLFREAERLLNNKPKGCFLIRVSESRFGYSLSFKYASQFFDIYFSNSYKFELDNNCWLS